jgi:iron complex transport system ATP-binding protein
VGLQIEVKDLIFGYGGETVLDGISLTIGQGDFIGIIGPNGSGKSTFLKNLAAILTPAAGEIIIDGKALPRWRRRELARRLALVGQGAAAGFNFTVEEMVAMGRYPHVQRFGSFKPTDHRAVERAMHLTGCYHLRERGIFSLSGGERQRVLLARALAQETPCLLLDEPTSFLDLGYQVELLELLRSLNQRERITVVMVMHDLNLASRYCRKLFLLYGGRIHACGDPEEVLTREHILEVYRTEVLIEPHPLDGKPQVIPVSTAQAGPNQNFQQRIHIIGGGGSASPLMKELFARGFSLSAGVLSVGDSDWATARRLGLTMVEEAPFYPISPQRHRQNLELIEKAGAVVLAPVYIGPGNLPNVEAALFALQRKRPLIVIDAAGVAGRDFTGGQGAALYRRLEEGGALFLPRPDADAVIEALFSASSGQ